MPKVISASNQLDMQLHHNFASRFLIDTLLRNGFFSSYQEVQLFIQNAALKQGTDKPDYDGEFAQYIADNVDHNLRTLDGNDTFHGMGMIRIITPGTNRKRSVLKTSQQLEPLEIKEIKYNDVVVAREVDPTANLDILWKRFLPFSTTRPAWAGMMQAVHRGSHQGKSSITLLLMIDLNPSEVTCISSTLKTCAAPQHR
ncbi:hypothetical protein ACROYT_G026583 [Oculina patagonica]